MKLYAFAEAFSQQLASAEFSELSFEERTGLLVDAEYTARENESSPGVLAPPSFVTPHPSRTSTTKHPANSTASSS